MRPARLAAGLLVIAALTACDTSEPAPCTTTTPLLWASLDGTKPPLPKHKPTTRPDTRDCE